MESGRKSPISFSSISMKYNVNEEEVKNVSVCEAGAKPEQSQSSDDLNKAKKSEKRGSIINKYFKSLKSEKSISEDGMKTAEESPSKENVEKNNIEASSISSGSPIKEYFNKFNKRADSVDASSEVDSIKDPNSKNEGWKLFNEFRVKIAQAVEDIKSNKNSEAGDSVKDKQSLLENASLTDSEDNSLHLEFDASTENQVSSLTSSTQNLSELSPPIISHSSTMTDMDIETTSSLETNKNVVRDKEKIKSLQYEDTDDENDEHLEVESGVEALEDVELVTEDKHSKIVNQPSPISIQAVEKKLTNFITKQENRKTTNFFSYSFLFITITVISFKLYFPHHLTFNGFVYGVYFSYVISHTYKWLLSLLETKRNDKQNQMKYSMSNNAMLSKLSQIVEFEPIKKYEGWINIYMFGKYDPLSYHISLTQTAFMKLEGYSLRISFTDSKIPKHALWDEPKHKVPFHQHRIYDLTGAKIQLLPTGIVKKRHWSKKYPICIILKDKSKLTVYNAKSYSTEESNQQSEDQTSVMASKDDSPTQQVTKKNKNSDICKSSPRKSLDFFDESVPDVPKMEEFSDASFNEFTKSVGTDAKENLENLKDKSINEKLNDDVVMLKETSNAFYADASTSDHNSDDDVNNDLDINKSCIEDDNIKILTSEWTKDELSEDGQEQVVIYLFGRTGRDKDEWFRRLKTAIDSTQGVDPNESLLDEYESPNRTFEPDDNDELLQLLTPQKDSESKVRMGSVKSEKKKSGDIEIPSMLWTSSNTVKPTPLTDSFRPKLEADFWKYMKDIIEFKKYESTLEEIESKNHILWLNALLGRVIFDTFKNSYWIKIVQDRIQKKLTSLKLPTFMGPLVVTALEFGADAPQFQNVSAPKLDSQGLWVDLQLCYNGRATMTLTTQLNLMKLKERRNSASNATKPHTKGNEHQIPENLHAVYHSDLDDTAESSSEDEAILAQSLPAKITQDIDSVPVPANTGNSSAKKILRLVDKIAANKYFQHVTDYKYVKRAMEGVSNTDLKLSVELCGLFGCLTINIPPPPSDRIWFGENPQLFLKAKPVVGSHTINIAHITSWIENKLCNEFEKLLVLPNMEDFQFDCMIPPTIE